MTATVSLATALVISNSARGVPSPWRCVIEFLSQQVHGAAGCDDGAHGRQLSSMLSCLCSIEPTSAPHTDYCTAETLGLAPRAPHHRGYCGPPQGETGIRLGWLQRHLQSPTKTTNVGSSTSTSSTLLTFRTTSIYPSLPQRAMSVVSTFADGHGGEMNNMVFAKL